MSAAQTLGADVATFVTQGAQTPGMERAATSALPIGALINGRYTIRRPIGRGGMGVVYDVADALHPGRAVALKVVPGIGSNAMKLSLFKAEFATMTKLGHPNIARVYDFEQVQGTDEVLITMELIEGAPIAGGEGWQVAVALTVQVCRALAYVHSRRIVHFDLKPANILVDRGGAVKVVDFGIAGAQPFGRGGAVMGTPQYMAPELLLGGGAGVDHRADLYSLGVTLYELLVGELPCAERELHVLAAWMNQTGVAVPAETDAPAWLKRLVERLCAKHPADRPRNANAVVQEINGAGGFDHQLETAETRQSYVMTPRFAGRAAEHERILGLVSRRLRGEGGCEALLVSGDSGIGKSRLMREVRRAAQMRRLLFLEGNCYERSLVEYGPIADVLQQLVPLVETLGGVDVVRVALPELVKLAPGLGDTRDHVASPKAATAEGERARLYETTTSFLLRAAQCVPFAIYLNDLHWAAQGTAQLFSLLAQRLRDEAAQGRTIKLALLGSYRSDEVEGRPLAATVRALANEGLAETLELAPLAAPEVSDVITSMLGIEDVPADFLTRVTRETAGNPFFVQEVMRALFDNGTVFLDEHGHWAARGAVGELEIPKSMTEVFRRRLAQLGRDEQRIVQLLAVHGRPIRGELLGEVHGDLTGLMKALTNLEAKAIVERQEGKGLAFNIAHDRMRETIYADLSAPERMALHRGIAEKLEAVSAGLDDRHQPLDELARHFRGANIDGKALDYARRAGKRAIESYANDAALEHLLYARQREPPEIEVLELLAEALVRKGEARRGAELLTEGLALCRTGGERARLHGKLARCRIAEGAFAECVEESTRALEELGVNVPRTPVAVTLAVLRDLAWVLRKKTFAHDEGLVDGRCRDICAHWIYRGGGLVFGKPRPLLMVHAAIRAAIFGERAGACEEPAVARVMIAIMFAWTGHVTRARPWLDAARERERRNDYPEAHVALAYTEFGIALGHGPCSPEQLPGLQAGMQKAKLVGTPLLGLCSSYFQHEATRLGAWEQAADAYRSVLLYMERFAPSFAGDNFVFCHAPLTLLHVSGSPAEAIDIARRVLERSRQRHQGIVEQAASASAAETLVAAGDLGGAVRLLESSLELAAKNHAHLLTREVFRLLPRLYLQASPSQGARRKAARVIDQGRKLVAKGHEDKRPLVELSEAILFEAQGKRAHADARFEAALRTARAQGARFYVYDIMLQRGLILEQRGERANARRDLDEARALAVACGDKYVTRLCDEASSS